MKNRYTIYFEPGDYHDAVQRIAKLAKAFDVPGYTLTKADGYWLGLSNPSYRLELLADFQPNYFAQAIKTNFEQTEVLLVKEPVDVVQL